MYHTESNRRPSIPLYPIKPHDVTYEFLLDYTLVRLNFLVYFILAQNMNIRFFEHEN